jgi:hypothetical protein
LILRCVRLNLLSQPAFPEKFPCETFAPSTDADVLLHPHNIFRGAGSVTMTLGKCHVRASNGNLIPVTAQRLTVSAGENFRGKQVEIALATPQEVVDMEHLR